jgi:phosphoglycerate dehydrogenase-like enzyme
VPKRRGKLLIAQSVNRPEEFKTLERYADVFWLKNMSESELDSIIPQVDAIYSHGWPKALDPKVPAMESLRLFQTGNAGVNGMPFGLFDERVVICSNAGGYSDEVAEHAIALMMAAGKGLVKFDRELRAGTYTHVTLERRGPKVMFFHGKTFGVVGYGGIGRSAARMAKGLGMKVLAYGRHPVREAGVKALRGRAGLKKLLQGSDVVLLAVPLTRSTRGLIGPEELSLMKDDSILVNIARGEVVQKEAVFDHLKANPGFFYATDVWWPGTDGRESFAPDLPFLDLPNFIGSPHSAAVNAVTNGTVGKNAVENLTRFYKGLPVKNVVDRSEYQ